MAISRATAARCGSRWGTGRGPSASAPCSTANGPLARQVVAGAVDEAGDYQLAGSGARRWSDVTPGPFGPKVFSERAGLHVTA